jgi:membrane associated rhomboid family serine protease
LATDLTKASYVQKFSQFQSNNLCSHHGCSGAIIPLNPSGLKGIFFSPFLHGSLEHIFGNSVPIFVLIFLLYQFYPLTAKKVFLLGWIATALVVWLLPPIDIFTGEIDQVCIMGASGIVYTLAFFIFFSGVFRWNMKLLTVSLIVALYYGSLIWGVVPEELFSNLPERSKISWQSHLSGAVVGIIMAFIFRNSGEKKHPFYMGVPQLL